MTSEVRHSGSISEFVSGGPKNYAYRQLTWDDRKKTVCKVKSIALNYSASKMVNFDVIWDMILRGKTGDELPS